MVLFLIGCFLAGFLCVLLLDFAYHFFKRMFTALKAKNSPKENHAEDSSNQKDAYMRQTGKTFKIITIVISVFIFVLLAFTLPSLLSDKPISKTTSHSSDTNETNTVKAFLETTPFGTSEPQTKTYTSQLDGYINKPLTEFMDKVQKIGYTAIYIADGVDFTEFIDLMKDDYLVGSIEEDHENKTVVVDLLLKTSAEHEEMERALRKKLEIGYAWSAAEKFGKEIYGNFELNYLVGKITEYADDADTWFLKSKCTLNGQEMICEAKVTGTTSVPEVIDFIVY